MVFSRLEKNLTDVVREEQVKLGYRSETVRLFYPILSLNRLLGADYDIGQMRRALEKFCDEVKERLGKIEVTNEGERFCLAIPPEGVTYVHEHMQGQEFIRDFITTVAKHDVTIEEVLEQFYKYSRDVHFEKVSHGEFDYLVYFENGEPDDFRYCITDEGCHFIYHRFTVEDYEDLML